MKSADYNHAPWWRPFLPFVVAWALMVVSVASVAAGRSHQYIPHSWHTEDGLPNNSVAALAQTRDGYLWVGTRGGLARFDGVRFTPFEVGTTKGRALVDLCEGRDGSLWIALEGEGVVRWNEESLTRYGQTNGLGSDSVRSLCAGKDGSIWIGTKAGLTRYQDGRFRSFTRRDGLPEASVQVVCEDSSGNLWVGTASGVSGFKNGKVTATYTTKEGLPSNLIITLHPGREGDLWIGTAGGLGRLSAGKLQSLDNKKMGLADHFVSALYEDRQGDLWIGAYGGLYRLVRDALRGTNQAAQSKCVVELDSEGAVYDQVRAILEDHEGNIWTGGKDGLNRLKPKPFASFTRQQGLLQNNTMSVFEDTAGALWAATWSGGLNRLKDGKLAGYTVTNGLGTDLLLSLAEGHDGSLWIGADHDGGLYRFKNGTFTHFSARDGLTNVAVRVIHEDRQSNLWIGTSETLTLFKGGTFRNFTTRDGLAGRAVRALLEDHEGNLWIGTGNGLSRRKDESFRNFTTRDGLSTNSILALYEDSENRLWIGTAGGGLNCLHGGVFTAYTTRQGLFSDEVFAILEDDSGHLWISCLKGVFRVKKQSLADFDAGKVRYIPCASFGKAEGMAGVQCNGVAQPAAWKSRDGRLWFATTKGLAVADPDIEINTTPPPVAIEEIIADKKPVGTQGARVRSPSALSSTSQPGQKTLDIAPGRGELEFHYTALSFQAPEENRFKYKLDNVDSDWVDAGTRRVAYYNNIYPGEYRFQVLACNKDGLWNESGASVALRLRPHFWQRWWFIGLASLTAVGMVAGTAARLVRDRVRRKLQRLQQQHALEQERARIAKDIHDDLGSSLTRITLLSELAEADKTDPNEVETHVRKIAASAREMVESLDEIVWAVSPGHDTWNSLAEYISEYTSGFFESTNVRCRLEMPLDLPADLLPSEVRHGLFLVIKEALNNILKHARASEARIKVSARDSVVEIVIGDDGCGFDPDGIATGSRRNGLQNMRQRIEALQGKFRVESQPGKGTRLTIAFGLDPNMKRILHE